ncbi:MAG TPA: FAD-binding oxidoreductase [Pirellulales bacterium]|nr:FAD-binding oxidoreductase [Pirellulales bacterium]
MSITSDQLPLTDTAAPSDQAELAAVVRQAYEDGTPLYPLGGGTCLEYGLSAKLPGWGLSLAGLDRVVDYPSRDMTITVEAGITMADLAAELAREGQRLPIDAAQANAATLGGVVAVNFSGPRRYGHGTVRDYVIGISAVDGRGTPFKGGGRVVKNVAGYDFCKLLTGSFGTLAVITQLTLKVKPLAEASAILACQPRDLAQAESLLAELAASPSTPAAIELLAGPEWNDSPELAVEVAAAAKLLVGLEGTRGEVDWTVDEINRSWRAAGVASCDVHRNEAAEPIWRRLTEFGARPDAPLTMKLSVRPSAVTRMVALCQELDPGCSLVSHAGNGIVLARFREFSAADTSRVIVQHLQPAAAAAGGSAVVWSCAAGELTRQAIWGGARDDAEMMRSVKRQFDPKGLLNPGRFVYGTP